MGNAMVPRNGTAPAMPIQGFQITPDIIEWDQAGDLPGQNANQTSVVIVNGQVHLTFYEALPPTAFTAAAMKKAKKVRARGVGRVVMSLESATQMFSALGHALQAAERQGAKLP